MAARELQLHHPDNLASLATCSSSEVDLANLLIWMGVPSTPVWQWNYSEQHQRIYHAECNDYTEAANQENFGRSYSKLVQVGRDVGSVRYFTARWIRVREAREWLLAHTINNPGARILLLAFDYKQLAHQVAHLWRNHILALLAPIDAKKREYDALLAEIDKDLQ